MASTATPVSRTFFMQTSCARWLEDERAGMAFQLTVWTDWSLLPRCNRSGWKCDHAAVVVNAATPRSGFAISSDHAEQMRQPQRNFRHVGDQREKHQHRTQPRQHRDRDLGDAHL